MVPELASLRCALPEASRLELTLELRTRSSSWGSYEAQDDVLLDLGPHLVDLVRWLSDAEVTRVRATVAASNATLELELSEGRGLARVKCTANRPYRERVLARDGNGRRLGRYSVGGVVTGLNLLIRGSSAEHPLVQSIALQLEAFGRAVRGDPEPILASAHDGVAVMATLKAARASAARGGAWESVQERLSGR